MDKTKFVEKFVDTEFTFIPVHQKKPQTKEEKERLKKLQKKGLKIIKELNL